MQLKRLTQSLFTRRKTGSEETQRKKELIRRWDSERELSTTTSYM